ncbi:hypothetical protein WDV06_31445 [Streptomyces racemochromogenes]|uniref:Uncharacterized protein n=1 Tax=Streptomyces racemochromogenes TaxID=67353 RepID=A0ABW7PNJ1_9ACTN
MAGQILASKWDAGYAVLVFVRALLGGLPAWAKWIIGGLVAVVLVLEGRRWWRRRGTAVR